MMVRLPRVKGMIICRYDSSLHLEANDFWVVLRTTPISQYIGSIHECFLPCFRPFLTGVLDVTLGEFALHYPAANVYSVALNFTWLRTHLAGLDFGYDT